MANKNSIIPSTGIVGKTWPNQFNLTQGSGGKISSAGWTYNNEGFIQQTFLGASILNFNITAGFGDTSSTLSVQLINDEYNQSDKTGFGLGDDVYHDGKKDLFKPPPVGSPVFFKFGKNHATIEQAWRRLFDITYGIQTLPLISEPSIIGAGNMKDADWSKTLETAMENKYFFDMDTNQFIDLSNRIADDNKEYAGDSALKFFGRGRDHFVFGGILQSYTQNKNTQANPSYNVQVVDPREILSNVLIILNNYTGSIYQNKNYVNVYGFLEYDVSDDLKEIINDNSIPGYSPTPIENPLTWTTDLPFPHPDGGKFKNNLEKKVDQTTGNMQYFGTDMYHFPPIENQKQEPENKFPQFFPITGEGFSRRSAQGIPFYRVRQAIDAIFEYNGPLPTEYADKGFGGQIDFRGFNYVVDFSGLPIEKIPQMYFLEFDQIDLLSLIQDVCDAISHDLHITLLPVINHPACAFLYQKNLNHILNGEYNKIIAGIIRIEAIDRSNAPEIGVIKNYIEFLKIQKGINVEAQDLGYELANISTDKMVVGAQEVNIHFFSDNKDRDFLFHRMNKDGDQKGKAKYEEIQQEQWSLERCLKQQIIPFYGFISKNVPTIPRGFGPYQQILLDATGLDANGVGPYYVATEMELRAAAVSYEQWARFLVNYNETYIEEYGENSIFYRELNNSDFTTDDFDEFILPEDKQFLEEIDAEAPWLTGRKFGVTVPRCVFYSERNYMGKDGYPASPCSPPFGYPLYYKRAEKIGIPEGGVVKYLNAITEVVSNYKTLLDQSRKSGSMMIILQDSIDQYVNTIQTVISEYNMKTLSEDERQKAYQDFQAVRNSAQDVIKALSAKKQAAAIRDFIEKNKFFIKTLNRISVQHLKNAKKVYQFIKNIADSHLGKSFLIKLPKATNVLYDSKISYWSKKEMSTPVLDDGSPSIGQNTLFNIKSGPFGFKPEVINKVYRNPSEYKSFFKETLQPIIEEQDPYDICFNFLDFSHEDLKEKDKLNEPKQYYYGGLKVNFNPISDNWEFNYKPEPQGGFFSNELFPNNLTYSLTQDSITLDGIFEPLGQNQLLIPKDLSNFESNGRICAYVRYDHSEDLDLSNLPKESFTQQLISKDESGNVRYIPDISEELNNIDINNLLTFDQIAERLDENGKKKKEAVAFVKCELDENIYLLPKIVAIETPVFGRKAQWVPNVKPLTTVETTNSLGCKETVPSKPYPMPIFTVPAGGGTDDTFAKIYEFQRSYLPTFSGELINSSKEKLAPGLAYALITLPGRIIPTVDKRFIDGPYQQLNGADLKHLLTQDTVNPPQHWGFDKPSQVAGKDMELDCNKFTFTQLTNAQKVQKSTLQNLGIADPKVSIGFSEPSPVYPNIVALPLLSREKCYGPWFSSSILNGYSNGGARYSNIGGKVEFVKDENLAPWNYAGYLLMNEAGALQAQFSNSLLLFSERGSISYPDIPSSIDLAKPLAFGGPLVTSISVDINESNVKTTIKMDLYTSRFGKLNKQKEILINQITREKQKLIDQKNYLIRRGFNKGFSNNDILSDIRNQGNNFVNKATETSDEIKKLEKTSPNIITISTTSRPSVAAVGATFAGFAGAGSILTSEDLTLRMSLLGNEGDPNRVNFEFSNTAASTIDQIFAGYTNSSIFTNSRSQNVTGFAAFARPGAVIESPRPQ